MISENKLESVSVTWYDVNRNEIMSFQFLFHTLHFDYLKKKNEKKQNHKKNNNNNNHLLRHSSDRNKQEMDPVRG